MLNLYYKHINSALFVLTFELRYRFIMRAITELFLCSYDRKVGKHLQIEVLNLHIMDLIVANDAGGKEEKCVQNQTTFHTLSLE